MVVSWWATKVTSYSPLLSNRESPLDWRQGPSWSPSSKPCLPHLTGTAGPGGAGGVLPSLLRGLEKLTEEAVGLDTKV